MQMNQKLLMSIRLKQTGANTEKMSGRQPSLVTVHPMEDR